MDLKTAFGKTIKKIRLKKGLSQENLAETSGLDVSFISLVENGKKLPGLLSINKLSEGLNIKTSDLYKEVEKKLEVE